MHPPASGHFPVSTSHLAIEALGFQTSQCFTHWAISSLSMFKNSYLKIFPYEKYIVSSYGDDGLVGKSACCGSMRTWVWISSTYIESCLSKLLCWETTTGWLSRVNSRSKERLCPKQNKKRRSDWEAHLSTCMHILMVHIWACIPHAQI